MVDTEEKEVYYLDVYSEAEGWVLYTVRHSVQELVELIMSLPKSLVVKMRVRSTC